jgi:endogenous inhibitor of DNA gyrase (YacG/DUF329 family)
MKTIPVNCSQCKIPFFKKYSEIKRQENRGINNHFCSNKCSCEYNKNINKNILKQRLDEYYKNPKKCLNCLSIIPYNKKNENSNYCSNKCAAIYTQIKGGHHSWSKEGKEKLSIKIKDGWKNGKYDILKTGETKICSICGKKYYNQKSSKRLPCCSKKCSIIWINRNGYMKGKTGGYREKGGRGKQGWYKGYYCNSSWELAWVIYQLEHETNFRRNTIGYPYEYNGKKFKFYPDFILDNGEYVEVKGYMDGKQRAKIDAFPSKLNVIGKNNIVPFIQYAEKKYGKNYIKLYESKEKSLSS